MSRLDRALHLKRSWLYLLGVLLLLFLNLPIFVIVPISFSDARFLQFPPQSWSLRWYYAFFSSQEWRTAAWISLQAALCTVAVTVPLGTLAAYGLHVRDNWLTRGLRALLVSPGVVPVVIIAIGIYFLLAQFGLNNTLAGLVLAHSVLAMPFVMIALAAGLASFDMTLERAARSLGASPVYTFLTVTVPNLRGSILTAAILAFLTSLDEVVVALFISSGPRSTLSRRMYASMRDQVDPTIAAISAMLIVLVLVFVAVMSVLAARNRNRHA